MKKAKKPTETLGHKGSGSGSDLSKLIETFKSTAKNSNSQDKTTAPYQNKTEANNSHQNSLPELQIPVYSKTTYTDIVNKHESIIKKIRHKNPIDTGRENMPRSKIMLSDAGSAKEPPSVSKPKFISSKPVTAAPNNADNAAVIKKPESIQTDSTNTKTVINLPTDSSSLYSELPLYPAAPGSENAQAGDTHAQYTEVQDAVAQDAQVLDAQTQDTQPQAQGAQAQDAQNIAEAANIHKLSDTPQEKDDIPKTSSKKEAIKNISKDLEVPLPVHPTPMPDYKLKG